MLFLRVTRIDPLEPGHLYGYMCYIISIIFTDFKSWENT